MPDRRCAPVHALERRDLAAQAELLKALADPHRLTIVATLAAAAEPVCVCDLTDGLPIGQSSVSHHLALLRDAGIVTAERRGTWAYYRLTPGLRARLATVLDAVVPKRPRIARAS